VSRSITESEDWNCFLRAIREAPQDDLPRLQAADWLEEHGEGERAEFIRVQCALALRESKDLRWREQALRNSPTGGPNWALEACPGLVTFRLPDSGTSRSMAGIVGWDRVRFERGFPNVVDCDAIDWIRHGSAIVPRQPVQAIVLRRCDDVPLDDWWPAIGAMKLLKSVHFADSSASMFPAWMQRRLGAGVQIVVRNRPILQAPPHFEVVRLGANLPVGLPAVEAIASSAPAAAAGEVGR